MILNQEHQVLIAEWWKKNSQKVPRRNCFELHGEMRDMNWPREKGEFMLRGQAI